MLVIFRTIKFFVFTFADDNGGYFYTLSCSPLAITNRVFLLSLLSELRNYPPRSSCSFLPADFWSFKGSKRQLESEIVFAFTLVADLWFVS